MFLKNLEKQEQMILHNCRRLEKYKNKKNIKIKKEMASHTQTHARDIS